MEALDGSIRSGSKDAVLLAAAVLPGPGVKALPKGFTAEVVLGLGGEHMGSGCIPVGPAQNVLRNG